MTDYITTRSGIDFDFLDPRPEQILIEDIAHALSHKCRFGGHLSSFYSVAQHSLCVSRVSQLWADSADPAAARAVALHGLLHDAPEAYMADIATSIKAHLPDCQAMEHRIWIAICARFGLSLQMPALVKQADQHLLATEARFFGVQGWERWATAEPIDYFDGWLRRHAWPPSIVRRMFMERFEYLTRFVEDIRP